jgi:hypothetical protein
MNPAEPKGTYGSEGCNLFNSDNAKHKSCSNESKK